MIYFKLSVENPWFRPVEDFDQRDYYHRDTKISANKHLEIQISKFEASELISMRLDLRWWGQDHQGPELELDFLGYMFNIKIYDRRHWNWDANRWQTYEEARDECHEWSRENNT